MFAPDQERAAAELLRVTRSGGRIVLGNWTPEGFIGEMFRVKSSFIPSPAGLQPPVLWGTETRLRDLFGDGIRSLQINRREFVFRFRSAAEFVDVFRTYYGPTFKAFETIGPERAPALADALENLAARWNRNIGNPIAIPAEYLEVIAIRR
jgi:hypothetical protein